MKLGIIQGSNRAQARTTGISRWATACISASHPDLTIVPLSLRELALPVEVDPVMPMAHPSSPPEVLASSYESPSIQSWSKTISSCDAILIVTPQYNWNIPAPLKNAIDHLYWEWVGRPVGLFTFGGHGGGKCCAALQGVLGGSVKARVASNVVNLTLPEYAFKEELVNGDESYLVAIRDHLDALVGELMQLTQDITTTVEVSSH